MSNKEMVNHPDHYQTKTGIEGIDAMGAATEELTGIEAVDTAQVIKYMWRWKKKEKPLQDLNKAKWYLEHLIAYIENQNEKENV